MRSDLQAFADGESRAFGMVDELLGDAWRRVCWGLYDNAKITEGRLAQMVGATRSELSRYDPNNGGYKKLEDE